MIFNDIKGIGNPIYENQKSLIYYNLKYPKDILFSYIEIITGQINENNI